MNTFPWARAMEIGLGQLRLAPRDFWAMTLPELCAAAGGAPGVHATGPTRKDFEVLSENFPD
tara:strand:- start:211494 stop:211679 length:186 start_codon:yes stop_codon:yes gene_type:complete